MLVIGATHLLLHTLQVTHIAGLKYKVGWVCRALPVYLPVYLIPALLVHRKALLSATKGPDIGRKVAVGAARSSLFLALYCTLCWRGACVGFQATRKLTTSGQTGRVYWA